MLTTKEPLSSFNRLQAHTNVMGVKATGSQLLEDLQPHYIQFHGSRASTVGPSSLLLLIFNHLSAIPTACYIPGHVWS